MSKVIINEEFKDFARNHTIKEIAQKVEELCYFGTNKFIYKK